MRIKEGIIVIGDENGIRTRELGDGLGMDPSAVSKRREAARRRVAGSKEMTKLLKSMRAALE